LAGSGSGFIISGQGLVVTNMHVVNSASRVEARIPSLQLAIPARVANVDQTNDLALLRIDSTPLKQLRPVPYRLADASAIAVGQDAWTLGFPLGSVMGSAPRLAVGTINSLTGIQDAPGLLQISAPLQPGNSGGPLFNKHGDIVGVVVASLNAEYLFSKAGILPQNVNFAVKVSLLRNLLESQPDWNAAAAAPSRGTPNLTLEELVRMASRFVVEIQTFSATPASASSAESTPARPSASTDADTGRPGVPTVIYVHIEAEPSLVLDLALDYRRAPQEVAFKMAAIRYGTFPKGSLLRGKGLLPEVVWNGCIDGQPYTPGVIAMNKFDPTDKFYLCHPPTNVKKLDARQYVNIGNVSTQEQFRAFASQATSKTKVWRVEVLEKR
jgi:hypothetical protein